MKLSELLKSYREKLGLTVEQAERLAGIPEGYLAQLESGIIRQASTHALWKLHILYKVELKELLLAGGVITKKVYGEHAAD